MDIFYNSRKIIQFFSHYIIFSLLYLVKVPFFIGSHFVNTTLFHIFGPLCGKYQQSNNFVILLIIKSISSLFLNASYGLHALHLPTLGSTLFWYSRSGIKNAYYLRFFIFSLLIGCFALFYIHPVGNQAMVYTCFWIIPCIMLLLNPKNLFLETLSSTLIMHAIGSVVWLYTHPITTPLYWISLIPVVIIERSCFTILMMGAVIVNERFILHKDKLFCYVKYFKSIPLRFFCKGNC